MKKWLILLCTLLLTGCGAGPQFETVSDHLDQVVSAAEPAAATFPVPEEAVLTVSEAGALLGYYVGPEGEYEILQQCFAAESLNQAVKAVTGFDADRITLVQTRQGDCQRYDMSWTAAGEGTQLCRGAILYDGSWYYSLTFSCPETEAQDRLSIGEACLSGFTLGSAESIASAGE